MLAIVDKQKGKPCTPPNTPNSSVKPTDAEQRLWYHLRVRRLGGYKFRRQMPIDRYIADFVCEDCRLIVEADGGQHDEQAAYDAVRSQALQQYGYTVVRFWNHDILHTEAVLMQILAELQKLSASRRDI